MVELRVIQCGACKDHPRTHQLPSDDGLAIAPVELEAGDYSVEVRAGQEFVGSVSLHLDGPNAP